MLRIIYLIFRILRRIPFTIFQIKRRKKHPEKYTEEENILWLRDFLRYITKRARVDLTINGIENLPKEAFVITPNHQGMFDIPVLFDAIDRPFKIVFKKELSNVIFLRDVVSFCNFPAIDRRNLRQSMKVIHQMTSEIKKGMSYAIFAEGTRSRKKNELLDFKGGSFKSAMDAKAPIVPSAMIDCYKVLDQNSIRKVKCQFHILKPIYYDEYKNMTSTELASVVHDRIAQCIRQNTNK